MKGFHVECKIQESWKKSVIFIRMWITHLVIVVDDSYDIFWRAKVEELFELHPNAGDFNYTEAFEGCKNYLNNNLMVNRLKAPKGSNSAKRQSKYECMFFIAVCKYMIYFAGMKLDLQ